MMRLAVLSFLLMAATAAVAQQTAQYTQNNFNMFALNPAVAGSKDCMDVRLGYRQQWVGFSGAPVTGWASIAGTIKPRGRAYRAHRHGIGAFVESDQAGPLGYTSFQLAYAYHLQMNRDVFLSMGLFAGFRQEKFSLGDVNATENTDPALLNNGNSLVVPDVTPGIWLYGKNAWAGLSIEQFLGNRVENIGTETRLNRAFLLSLGQRFALTKDFSVVPSAFFRYAAEVPLVMDLNVMMEYKRRLGIGATYRNQDAVAFMVKLPFLKYFTLGYSYDITTSSLRAGGANTHEIILGIYPCTPLDPDKAIVRCPIFE
jgi:type IX secretion system PorP/SprF family membrane protein